MSTAHSQRRGIAVVAGAWGNRDLRRLTLAWGAFFLIDSITLVSVSVWAFDQGGASAVGLIGVCRLLPGALTLPIGAWAADRFPRRRVVGTVFAAELLALVALSAAMAADAPLAVVASLVGAASVALTPYRPAHLALVPLVSRSAEELVAANVTGGAVDGLATLAGPVLAAVLLIAGGPPIATASAAVAAALGLVAVLGVRPASDPSAAARLVPESPVAALSSGFRVLWRERDQALVVGCFVTQLLVRGLLSVLLVLVALDMFDLGDSGVGWLSAVIGAGGAAGAAMAIGLTGRRQLASLMALGLVLWGAPIAVIGLVPEVAVAVASLFVIGLGNSLMDVTGFTLLQRMSDDVTLGRVFGAFFTTGVTISAGGAAVAPVLVDAVGLRSALAITGAVLPATALLALRRLRRIDTRSEPPGEALGVLSRIPLLADLAPTTLEKLAARSSLSEVEPGEVVVTRGDEPDRFYVLVDGAAEVLSDGILLNRLVPGDHFGEIAVIGGGVRTATVRTTQPSRLLSIAARDFVHAVNGNASAFALTTGVIGTRLANDRLRTSTSV